MGDAIILNDYEFTPVKKAKLTEQLFPNEKEIFKCSSCLKMIPNSLLNDHKCRDDNKGDIQTIGSIKFERSTADKYMCTVCKKLFHHLLMKPHANTHEKLDETPTKATSISKFDIQMKCVLMDVVKDKLAVCEQLKIAKSSSKSADERSVSPETTDHLIANSFAKSAVNIITKTSSPESKPIDLEPKKDLESKKVLKLPKEPKPASHSSKIHSTPKGVSSFHKENTSIASKIITKNWNKNPEIPKAIKKSGAKIAKFNEAYEDSKVEECPERTENIEEDKNKKNNETYSQKSISQNPASKSPYDTILDFLSTYDSDTLEEPSKNYTSVFSKALNSTHNEINKFLDQENERTYVNLPKKRFRNDSSIWLSIKNVRNGTILLKRLINVYKRSKFTSLLKGFRRWEKSESTL